jgi:RHS repeat-associated protein
VTTNWAYQYDPAGRLVGVYVNGRLTASYGYDTNSNRVSATTSGGAVTGSVDAQDRLLTYGNISFTYAPNGELASRTPGTTYADDAPGNLLSVTLPSGDRIDYIIDAENRRVGKKSNGQLVTGYAYFGSRLVAELDGSNAIVSRFVYGTRDAVPDYMIRAGITYRIFCDPLGSPRLVVNTSTGQIADRIDYDEFGNEVLNTAPGFIPFGFAGGLYDPETALVRFGARDYDPSIGRWTAKDPILFLGADTNLYAYAGNDPVNLTDRTGRCDQKCRENKKRLKDYMDAGKVAKKIRKGVDAVSKGDYTGAVKGAAMDAAKSQSPLSGDTSKDYQNSMKETNKTAEFIQQKGSTTDVITEKGSTCVVNLQGGTSDSDNDKPPPQQNQPPPPRVPPPTWTPTQAARTGAQIAGNGY